VFNTKYYSDDQIAKNAMGSAVACVWERRGAYRFSVGKPGGKRTLEVPGVDGRIILRCIFRKCDGGMDWIDLAQTETCGGYL
jgi:hypothetical protein